MPARLPFAPDHCTAGEPFDAAPSRGPAPVPARRPWWRRLLRRGAGLLLAVLVLAAGVVGWMWATTPGVGDAEQRVTVLLAEHGATPLAGDVPSRVAAALLASEDSRFRQHIGVDWRGALRAPLGLVTGTDLGGSTLNQQLARLVYENGAKDPAAKARAVVLAVKLDLAWSKDEILRMYLDASYFGHGFYGLTAAAEGYFGRSPDELTWAQASVLAGLVQAPSAYDPLAHPELAAARQGHVLDRLVAVGMLTRAQADDVRAQPWDLVAG